MELLIAIDKFKNSLSSSKAADALEKGFKKASASFSTRILPLSDGGEGLEEVIKNYLPCKTKIAKVSDPLFREIEASYLMSENNEIAFIEMARASGLGLLHPYEYNCALTSSYGTGQLIRIAIKEGARKIVLGIGGSATNDCGIGMAVALGYRFLDTEGNELQPTGGNLIKINSIDASQIFPLNNIEVEVACDVANFLTGPEGATYMYGPQKGATKKIADELEEGMLHFASVVKRHMGIDLLHIKGGGAAGGMGAGAVVFLNASVRSGIELILHYSNAVRYFLQADIIITGEGKIDSQTLNGKLVKGVSELAAKYNKPVIAVCGILDINEEQIKELGLTAAFSIINKPMSLEDARTNAAELLIALGYNIGSMLLFQQK